MARYPAAIWRPCDKHGYGNDDTHLHEGIVAHSMEGSLAAAFGELDNPNRQASWWFSVAKDGKVYQHVDTDNIAWTNGSRNANKKFWGIEHEGRAGEPLTTQQITATTALMGWLLSIAGLAPARRMTLWEHNEMTAFGAAATACPSGRIPWNEILIGLQTGDDMSIPDGTQKQIDDIQKDADAIQKNQADLVSVHIKGLLDAIKALEAKLDAHNASGAHTH